MPANGVLRTHRRDDRKTPGRHTRSYKVTLASVAATSELGSMIGRALTERDTVALIGELGAGKTSLVKGIARGIESKATVTSPTFVLIHEYRGRLPLIHMDLYRLRSLQEAEGLGIDEYFDTESAIVIEWADRFPMLLPDDRLQVRMVHRNRTARTAELSAWGAKAGALLHRIVADLPHKAPVKRPHAARRGKARPQ